MLAGLHRLPAAAEAVTRAGGAWHHLADGSPGAEIAAAAALLAAAGERVTPASVMRVRPSIFEMWAFCTGRKSAADAAGD